MTASPLDQPTTVSPPWSLQAYRRATSLMRPVAHLVLKRRLAAGKEDPNRVGERCGVASIERPSGLLLWVHGASVGESLSILPLIDRLSTTMPGTRILVTTGTITSAALMAERLPEKAIHQYAPIDQPAFVNKFLDHWRPDAALFIESELWPSLILNTKERGVPMGLVNGRLSPKSFMRWSKRPKAAQALLSAFQVILGQDTENAQRLSLLTGKNVLMAGNLKQAADTLPTDDDVLDVLCKSVGGRPVWLAASTHPGEELQIIDAHRQLRTSLPDVLTVITPRHPERGDEVGELITEAGLTYSQRSKGALPARKDDLYLADTLGELGLFYRMSDVAFIGGSLVEIGGHNPMEPARLGTAIVSGPHVFNFKDTFDSMRNAGAVGLVRNERDLVGSVLRLLNDSKTRKKMASDAKKWADDGGDKVLDDILGALRPVLLHASDETG